MWRRVILIQLALCVSLFAQANMPVPQMRNGFRITGTVVSATGGQDLAQTLITIIDTQRPSITQSMTTGADGRFHFENLAAGKYVLTGQRRGYAQQSFDEHFQFSTAIAVGPGLESENLVFRLRPDASITGAIVDEQNEPVRGADVMLFRKGNETGDAEVRKVKDDLTDDRGRYLFGQLRPGAYLVVVSATPWYAQQSPARYRMRMMENGTRKMERVEDENENNPLDVAYPLTYYPGVTDASAATPLAVKKGNRVEADLSLSPVQAVHLKVQADTSGGVGANVTQTIFGSTQVQASSMSTTNNEGEVEVYGLAPGDYDLNIHTYGKTPHSWVENVDATGNMKIDSSQTPPAPPINGVVAVDGQLAPSSAYVQLYNRAGQVNVGARITEKGQFRIDSSDIKSGDYEVYVYNVPRAVVTGVLASGGTAKEELVTITKGTPVELAITMSTALGEVNGVAEFNGKPQAGAMIVLVPDDPVRNIELFRRDQSDSDGTFTLPSVVPGKYTVLALANGWDLEWNKPAVLEPYLKLGEKLEVLPRGKYQMKLQIQ